MQQQIKVQQIKNYQSIADLEPANYQKAVEQTKNQSNRYYKGEQVPWLGQLSHFKIYGVGIYLFFSFLKHAAVLFAILTAFSIVPIVFNVTKGNTLQHSASGLNIYLSKTSLGSYKYALMTVSNSYELSISYKDLNVAFDILACVIYLIFCLYWEKKSRKIAYHISKQIKLQSNLTLQVTQFPEDTKEIQIQDFMNKFGNVTEVVAARDYTKQIQVSKKIYELELLSRELNFEDIKNNQAQINQINAKILKLHSELDQISTRTHKITKFYVQFQTPQIRNSVRTKFQPYQRFFSCFTAVPNQLLMGNEKLIVIPCNAEPAGILWQNVHFTWRMRIPRLLLQLIIVLGIIIGGFIFISFLNILVPPIDTDIDTSQIDFNYILGTNNTTIVKAWCVQNYQLNGTSSPYFATCEQYWKMYFNSIIISISISLIILILCQVIKKIVYTLATFQRYSTKSQESVTIMTNMFIMEFLTTTLITFLMQANIFSLSVMSFMNSITTSATLHNNIINISQYKDLTPGWYKDIGFQIWFNIFIQIFIPQIFQPLLLYINEYLSASRAKKEKIHYNMVKILQRPQFVIQDLYANLLVIIATGLIFGGGIQLMMIVVFLCILVRYFYLRFLFTRYCKVPLNYNQILNERVILILKILLLIRCLISLYMYGANDVFAMQKSTFMKWASSLSVPVFSSIFVVFSRILLTWYYSIFVLLFILVLIFKQLIFKGVNKFKKWRKIKNHPVNPNTPSAQILQNSTIKKKKPLESQLQESIQSWVSNQNDTVKSQRKVLKSYRLEQNPNYSQILVIMKLKVQKQKNQKIFQQLLISGKKNPTQNQPITLKKAFA